MSDDNTQDGAEPSPASAGSHGGGIVARLRSWRDERGYPTPGEMLDEAADEIDRLRLTDAERDLLLRLGPRVDAPAGRIVHISVEERKTAHGLIVRLGGGA